MNNHILYSACPACQASNIQTVFEVKDHTVSNTLFTIMQCNHCSLRFTQNVPDQKAIIPYYKSDKYISHSNSSNGIINKLYQLVRTKTLVQKRKLIQKHTAKEKGSLLDVGSGSGAFVNEMKQQGWNVTGLEPDSDARNNALALYKLSLNDIADFKNLPANHYDAITLWHVLEHVHQLEIYIQQLKNLLKPQGRIFIAVPNYTSLDAENYNTHWAAYDVPRHLYHFSPKAMNMLIEKHGMKIIAYQPMWFDSFYISMLSSKYKNGVANLLGSFFVGLQSNIATILNPKKCSSIIYIIQK